MHRATASSPFTHDQWCLATGWKSVRQITLRYHPFCLARRHRAIAQPQRPGKQKPKHHHNQAAHRDDGAAADAVVQPGDCDDAEGITQKKHRCKQRHGSAACLGGHAGGVGLHGVVEHEKAEACEQAARRCKCPVGRKRKAQRAEGDHAAAAHDHAALAKTANQMFAHHHEGHAAQTECGDDGTRCRQRDVELEVQVRRPDGERAINRCAFKQCQQQHDARPRAGEDDEHLADEVGALGKLAQVRGVVGFGHGVTLLALEVHKKQAADHGEQDSHDQKR